MSYNEEIMENILSNNLSYLELLPYFSVEIMCLIGVIANILMYLLLHIL